MCGEIVGDGDEFLRESDYSCGLAVTLCVCVSSNTGWNDERGALIKCKVLVKRRCHLKGSLLVLTRCYLMGEDRQYQFGWEPSQGATEAGTETQAGNSTSARNA